MLLVGCGPSPRPLPPLPAPEPTPAYLPQQPRLVWSRDTGTGLLAPLTARGSALFATTTNRLVVALGNQDGRRYWYQRFDAPISTGVLIDGNRIFFATAALRGQAVALDATRGRKVWSRRIGSTHLPPLMHAGHIYFATDDGSLHALNRDDGDVVWQARMSAAQTLAPVGIGDRVITASAADTLYALDAATGRVLQRTKLAATPSAAALLVGDTVYLPLADGTLQVVNARSFESIASAKLPDPVLATPASLGSRIYALTRAGELWRVDGTPRRLAAFGAAARASLAAIGENLVMGLLDGRVIAVDREGGILWEYQARRSVVAAVTPTADGLLVPVMDGEVLKLQ